MKQAKTLTAVELRRVTDSIATRAHPVRNRAMLMMTHLAGLRVGEVAQLAWADVVTAEGAVREEVRLNADQTLASASKRMLVDFASDLLSPIQLSVFGTDTTPFAIKQFIANLPNSAVGS